MQKLAICLQVCPNDVWLGLRLIKLICKIEPAKRNDVEFIVSARRDTNPPAVEEILTTARGRFASVKFIKGKRFGTGWPQGCNDLWQETMMRASMMYNAKQLESDGVLTFEADCLPLRPDWLDCLIAEWSATKARGKLICGHAHPRSADDPTPTHINGNAIFHVGVTAAYPALNGCDARSGWDAFHGALLLSIGRDTSMIFQKYRIKQTTLPEVMAIRKDEVVPALFHGIKKESGMDAVEAMIKDGSFYDPKRFRLHP